MNKAQMQNITPQLMRLNQKIRGMLTSGNLNLSKYLQDTGKRCYFSTDGQEELTTKNFVVDGKNYFIQVYSGTNICVEEVDANNQYPTNCNIRLKVMKWINSKPAFIDDEERREIKISNRDSNKVIRKKCAGMIAEFYKMTEENKK